MYRKGYVPLQNSTKSAEEIELFNQRTAFVYYERAASQNNTKALLRMGDYFSDVHLAQLLRISLNYTTAVKYYKTARQLNNAQAMFNLGLMSLNGHGLPRDLDLAAKYFTLSGQTDTKNSLAVFLALVWVQVLRIMESSLVTLENILLMVMLGVLIIVIHFRIRHKSLPVCTA